MSLNPLKYYIPGKVILLFIALLPLLLFSYTYKSFPREIINTAAEGAEITSDEKALALKIQKYGKDAGSYIAPLYNHSDKEVRQLTYYILSEMEEIALKELRNIARTGSPEAIDFLTNRLIKEESPSYRIINAYSLLGEKGLPALSGLLKNNSSDRELMLSILSIIDDIQLKSEYGAHILSEILSGENLTEETIDYTRVALSKWEEAAVAPLTDLVKHKSSHKYLMRNVLFILENVRPRSEESVRILTELLTSEEITKESLTYTIYALSEWGETALPPLTDLIKNNSSDKELMRTVLLIIKYIEPKSDYGLQILSNMMMDENISEESYSYFQKALEYW